MRTTEKHKLFQEEFHEVVNWLLGHRARGRCEVKASGCWVNRWLTGHHIIRRSHGGLNTKENILIVCPNCHSHANYHTGIKGYDGKAMSIEDQLKLAKKEANK